jgi:DNA-binding Lrp family transcriptional regulator
LIIGDVDIEVIGLFSRDLASFYSINEISKLLHKSYPYVNKRVNLMIKEGVLCKRNIGSSYLCYLNLSSKKTLALLMMVWSDRQERSKVGLDEGKISPGCSCILCIDKQLIAVSETPIKGTRQLSEEEFDAYLKKEGTKGILPVYGYERYIGAVRSIEGELRMGRLDW